MKNVLSISAKLVSAGVLATGLVFSPIAYSQTAAQQLLKAEQQKTIQKEAEDAQAAEAAFLNSPEGKAWMKEREDAYNKRLEEEEKERQEQAAAAEAMIKREMERLEKEPETPAQPKKMKISDFKARMEQQRKEAEAKRSFKLLGCFKDQKTNLPDLKGRDLDGLIVSGPKNSGMACASYCKTKGFKYAGTQWGKYCHCGNSYGKYGTADNCNKPCTGNPKENCGGGLANTVYEITPGTATATAAATTTTPAPTPDAGSAWVAGNAPANATVAGQSGGKPLNICRMPVPSKEVHVGKAWNNSCYVGFGGKELKEPLAKAEVLTVANTSWVAVTDGKTPETAFEAGKSGGLPMNVCRAKVPSGEVHPGKLWKGNCYIGFGGKEVKTPTYEVMMVTK